MNKEQALLDRIGFYTYAPRYMNNVYAAGEQLPGGNNLDPAAWQQFVIERLPLLGDAEVFFSQKAPNEIQGYLDQMFGLFVRQHVNKGSSFYDIYDQATYGQSAPTASVAQPVNAPIVQPLFVQAPQPVYAQPVQGAQYFSLLKYFDAGWYTHMHQLLANSYTLIEPSPMYPDPGALAEIGNIYATWTKERYNVIGTEDVYVELHAVQGAYRKLFQELTGARGEGDFTQWDGMTQVMADGIVSTRRPQNAKYPMSMTKLANRILAFTAFDRTQEHYVNDPQRSIGVIRDVAYAYTRAGDNLHRLTTLAQAYRHRLLAQHQIQFVDYDQSFTVDGRDAQAEDIMDKAARFAADLMILYTIHSTPQLLLSLYTPVHERALISQIAARSLSVLRDLILQVVTEIGLANQSSSWYPHIGNVLVQDFPAKLHNVQEVSEEEKQLYYGLHRSGYLFALCHGTLQAYGKGDIPYCHPSTMLTMVPEFKDLYKTVDYGNNRETDQYGPALKPCMFGEEVFKAMKTVIYTYLERLEGVMEIRDTINAHPELIDEWRYRKERQRLECEAEDRRAHIREFGTPPPPTTPGASQMYPNQQQQFGQLPQSQPVAPMIPQGYVQVMTPQGPMLQPTVQLPQVQHLPIHSHGHRPAFVGMNRGHAVAATVTAMMPAMNPTQGMMSQRETGLFTTTAARPAQEVFAPQLQPATLNDAQFNSIACVEYQGYRYMAVREQFSDATCSTLRNETAPGLWQRTAQDEVAYFEEQVGQFKQGYINQPPSLSRILHAWTLGHPIYTPEGQRLALAAAQINGQQSFQFVDFATMLERVRVTVSAARHIYQRQKPHETHEVRSPAAWRQEAAASMQQGAAKMAVEPTPLSQVIQHTTQRPPKGFEGFVLPGTPAWEEAVQLTAPAPIQQPVMIQQRTAQAYEQMLFKDPLVQPPAPAPAPKIEQEELAKPRIPTKVDTVKGKIYKSHRVFSHVNRCAKVCSPLEAKPEITIVPDATDPDVGLLQIDLVPLSEEEHKQAQADLSPRLKLANAKDPALVGSIMSADLFGSEIRDEEFLVGISVEPADATKYDPIEDQDIQYAISQSDEPTFYMGLREAASDARDRRIESVIRDDAGASMRYLASLSTIVQSYEMAPGQAIRMRELSEEIRKLAIKATPEKVLSSVSQYIAGEYIRMIKDGTVVPAQRDALMLVDSLITQRLNDYMRENLGIESTISVLNAFSSEGSTILDELEEAFSEKHAEVMRKESATLILEAIDFVTDISVAGDSMNAALEEKIADLSEEEKDEERARLQPLIWRKNEALIVSADFSYTDLHLNLNHEVALELDPDYGTSFFLMAHQRISNLQNILLEKFNSARTDFYLLTRDGMIIKAVESPFTAGRVMLRLIRI